MKKINTKLTIFAGVVCALLVVLSSWYTITFNDSRFIAPMNFSEYSCFVYSISLRIVSTGDYYKQT